MPNLSCNSCGGFLAPVAGNSLLHRCSMCGKEQRTAAAEPFSKLMEAFDAQNREKVQKLLRRRHEAVTAEYVSSTELTHVCDELLTLMPEDFLSGFYKIAAGSNLRALNRAIREIDVERYYDDVAELVPFLVASMTADKDCLLALNDLVERAYKGRDLSRFHEFSTLISKQAEKVKAGVYETSLPRDVFVAYSSKDMAHVQDLVEELEDNQGFSCFVAARNLRHGVGSVEQYNAALAEAMDNCRTVVFVSSTNSRSFSCDALKIELAYVMQQDIDAAPQYRNDYEAMPAELKKPRVEYRVEQSPKPNTADRKVAQFFAGYEWVLTPEDVAERVADQVFASQNPMTDASRSAGQTDAASVILSEDMIQRRVEEELRRRAEEEEIRRRVEEEEARQKAARKKAEEEERNRQEEARKKAAEEEARKKAAEEERKRQEAEEEARRRAAEVERKRREAEEEARRKAAEKWKVGNTITLGQYEQKAGQGKAPIEWLVLANEGSRVLIISKYILDCQPYNTKFKAVTWETCSLRKWLNRVFLNTAFKKAERTRIIASKIQNPKNALYNTNSGNETIDSIFCLSIDEANRLFASDVAMLASATAAIQFKGQIYVYDNTGTSRWWLRSLGSDARSATYVSSTGGVDSYGDDVISNGVGVRPAMWIKIES